MSDLKKDWYKEAVFYELYVRAFYDSNSDGHGDLFGVTQKLEYLKNLGVDCIWLLPIYQSPLKDDGYDISDFKKILPEYGDLDDFRCLVDKIHQYGMKIIIDLVLNHTSDQHSWFQSARGDKNSIYRDYYVWSDTNQKYRDARIIFLDSEVSNWSWDDKAQQYYWHRFYSCQPDLNYDNPLVHQEIIKIVDFWLEFGIDGFRVDAVPYLYEREGSNCENLPETHKFLKHIRSHIDQNYPGKVLLCEANQLPEDVIEYFGDGDECHMGFHFPLMPRIFMALEKQNSLPIVNILKNTPEIPDNCQWCIFLRNHDELTLEMVTNDEREWMWKNYAPDINMRLNLGIRRRLASLLDNNQKKIELAYSLLFTLPGSPIIYYGDEIAMGDDISLPDRNGLRTPMQWTSQRNAGFSSINNKYLYSPIVDNHEFSFRRVNVELQENNPNSLLNRIRNMIGIRKSNQILINGTFEIIDQKNRSLFLFERRWKNNRLFIIHNLSSKIQRLEILQDERSSTNFKDLLTFEEINFDNIDNSLILDLYPHQYLWLV